MKSTINLTRLLIIGAAFFSSSVFGQSRSYIQQDIVRVAGATTDAQVTALPQTSKRTTRTYLDGMGRAVQTVAIKASPNGYDVVQPIAYDNLGRQTTGFLPYVATTTDGSYHPNAVSVEQPAFYNNGLADQVADDSAPFSQQIFENSPLQRLFRAGSIGAGYQPVSGQHYKTVSYRSNTSADNVLKWKNDATAQADGTYSANLLSVTDGTDEQGVRTLVFTDLDGRTVLKRQVKGSGYLDTYYVYKASGALAYVIPPKAVSLMQASNNYLLTISNVNALLFKYDYDARGRLITKKVPGAGEMSIVYDPLDRPVLVQDANLRAHLKWNYIKYDSQGRAVSQGIYSDSNFPTRAAMQSYITSIASNYDYTWFESRSTNAANGNYTNSVFPTNGIEPLAYSYFDDYDVDQDANSLPDYQYQLQADLTGQPATATTLTRGMLTVIKKRTIGAGLANLWITTVNFYDDNGRELQSIGNNHMQATISDSKTVITDFEGKTLLSKVVKVSATSTTKVKTAYTYDEGGRVLGIDQYYNDNAIPVLVASYKYNELGQVIRKGLGTKGLPSANNIALGTANSISSGNLNVLAGQSITIGPDFSVTNGATFTAAIATSLQDVDFRYNIRGQLLGINNSMLNNDGGSSPGLFGMSFVYDTLETGLNNTQYYNGRISAIKWRTRDANGVMGNERSYKYSYDEVNRLTAANYQERATGGSWDNSGAFNENGITYDENGNIQTLLRNARKTDNTISAADILTYTYDTGNANRLLSVVDASNNNLLGFKKLTSNTTGTYTYDDNGNLLNDPFKGMVLSYNDGNRLKEVTVSSGSKLVYTYDAANVLLRKQQYSGINLVKTIDYSDGFVYENTTLSYFGMPEGRVRNAAGVLKNEYIITDQQGNSRISFEDDGNGIAKVVQENSYYAFGMIMPNSYVTTLTQQNKNLYNGGSENQDDLGGLPDLMQTYYRNYDAAFGRWTGVDPKADAVESLTSYQYAANDPIMMNDPLGDLNIAQEEMAQASRNNNSSAATIAHMNQLAEWSDDFRLMNEDWGDKFSGGSGGIKVNADGSIGITDRGVIADIINVANGGQAGLEMNVNKGSGLWYTQFLFSQNNGSDILLNGGISNAGGPGSGIVGTRSANQGGASASQARLKVLSQFGEKIELE